jgi:hypothetical protein
MCVWIEVAWRALSDERAGMGSEDPISCLIRDWKRISPDKKITQAIIAQSVFPISRRVRRASKPGLMHR